MRHLRFGRRPYWFAVITLIVLKFGGVMVMLSAPQTYGILHHVDTALADIGWPRWFGITMVFLITLVLPLALFFAQPRIPARGQSPLDVLPDLAWISTVLLAILLIVAGIKRSASDFAADETGGTGAGYDNRKEPTFP